MKKAIPVIVFVVGFLVAYYMLSFGIPAMRIKLAAEPVVYFWESIKHGALFKSAVSLAVGGVFSLIVKKMK